MREVAAIAVFAWLHAPDNPCTCGTGALAGGFASCVQLRHSITAGGGCATRFFQALRNLKSIDCSFCGYFSCSNFWLCVAAFASPHARLLANRRAWDLR